MSRSTKSQSSSFLKFVTRLQHTFSLKSSTVIMQQQSHPRKRKFSSRCQLSQILFDPSRPVEYLSEIKDDDDSNTISSCNSISIHQTKQFNLSRMNISMEMDDDRQHRTPQKRVKLPNSLDTIRLHSTAIHDISTF